MKKLFLLSVVFFIFNFSNAFAQQSLFGKLIDSTEHIQIPHAYIENITQNFLSQADNTGTFNIPASIGDTIVFSSVGYYWSKIIVSELSFQTVYLNQQIYNIGNVIKNAPVSYIEFKRAILAMNVYEDTLDLHLPFEKYIPMNNYSPGELNYTVDGAITALYNATNKHAKNRLRAIELINQEHTLITINEKFNKEIVIDLTNIPMDYLNQFMEFCAFTDTFLIEATEFQIISMLYLKFDEFSRKYPELQKL